MTHHDAVETLAAERYLLDEMSEQERHQFEEHFFECGDCAENMRLGSRLRGDAKALFPEMPAAEHATGATVLRWRRPLSSTVMPWAAAAVLALALVYEVRQPGGDDQARVFAPVSLRPASRGLVTTVPLRSDDGWIALALDVNIGTAGDPLTYRLTREDDAVVASGTASVPSSGTPLLLVVPTARLGTGGPFVLTLTPDLDSTTPPAEYRFNTSAR